MLAELLGTMENVLAADVTAEVDMVEEDDLDSNTLLAQAYQQQLCHLKDTAVNTGGVATTGCIV